MIATSRLARDVPGLSFQRASLEPRTCARCGRELGRRTPVRVVLGVLRCDRDGCGGVIS